MTYPILRIAALLAGAFLAFGATPNATRAAVAPTIAAISAGYTHTCALTNAGGVKCWGQNGSGQLGNGTTRSSNVPVDVSGLSSPVRAIAAGGFHTCAITIAGGVTCWGKNPHGALGDGTQTNSSVPVAVAGLASGVRAIAAGAYHTCAVMDSGSVKCWGANYARLPDQVSSPFSSVPVDVAGLAGGATAVAAGAGHTCVLMSAGGVKCWGSNWTGQLGNGTTADSLVTPVDVSGLTSGVAAISVGYAHSCALISSGAVKCWGYNDSGQLGTGSISVGLVPAGVSGLQSVSDVALGSSHTCALTSVGAVRCWGSNYYGQLGNGSTTDSRVPVDVPGLAGGVTAVSAGYLHTCALRSGGVACWGDNQHGQLGNGTRTASRVPVAVDFTTNQRIDVRASEPPGRLAAGTAVTFSATVTPVGQPSDRPVVRFEIYRQDNGVWRRTAHRDVVADARGRAILQWTFATTGSRYVRARALASASAGASPWSARTTYIVA